MQSASAVLQRVVPDIHWTALIVDKAMCLKYIGGVFGGNVKPTPFLCLLLKMLQIQPEKDIVIYFITQPDYKYVRALGAMYLRLTGTSMDCYKYLEPLLLDYRKIRRMNRNGQYELTHMDEYIDEILHEERLLDCILPRIQKRYILEDSNRLDGRVSALEVDLDDMETSDEEEVEEDGEYKGMADVSPEKKATKEWERPRRSPSPKHRRSRSRSPMKGNMDRRQPPGYREHERDQGRDQGRGRGHQYRDHERHRDSREIRDNRDNRDNRDLRDGRDRRERDRDHDRARPRRGSRDRDRDRHRKRSRSRDRDHEKSDKKKRSRDDDKDRHKSSKKSSRREKDHSSKGGGSRKDTEIQEANALRASLGLAPLK